MSDSELKPPSSLEEAVKQPDGDLQILTHSPSPPQGKTLLPAELVEVKCEALEADTEPQTPQEVGKAEHEDAKVDGLGAGEATFVHCEIVKAELPDCANRFEEELPLSSLAASPEVQPLGCRQHRLVAPKNLGVHSLPAASEEMHSSQLPAACGDWPQQTDGAALQLVVQLTETDREAAEASTAVPSSIQCADAKSAGLTSVKTESEDPTNSPSMIDVISEDPDYIASSPSASPVAEPAPSSDFVAPLPESRPHPCEECGKGFPNRGQLRRHMLTHTGERRHLCSQCAQRFTHYTHLLSHEKAVHEGEKPHSCEVCGRGFSQVANLYRHIRTHTGERPFVCGDCGRTFAQQTGLMRHRRSHTGERPYECPECGSAFTQKVNLTQHLRVHTGERPYVCSTCSRGFAQRSNLYAHMRSAHGVSRPGRTTNAVLGQGYPKS